MNPADEAHRLRLETAIDALKALSPRDRLLVLSDVLTEDPNVKHFPLSEVTMDVFRVDPEGHGEGPILVTIQETDI